MEKVRSKEEDTQDGGEREQVCRVREAHLGSGVDSVRDATGGTASASWDWEVCVYRDVVGEEVASRRVRALAEEVMVGPRATEDRRIRTPSRRVTRRTRLKRGPPQLTAFLSAQSKSFLATGSAALDYRMPQACRMQRAHIVRPGSPALACSPLPDTCNDTRSGRHAARVATYSWLMHRRLGPVFQSRKVSLEGPQDESRLRLLVRQTAGRPQHLAVENTLPQARSSRNDWDVPTELVLVKVRDGSAGLRKRGTWEQACDVPATRATQRQHTRTLRPGY